MPVQLSVQRPDWNRADDGSTLVIILSARDPLTRVMFLLSYEWHRNNLIKRCAQCLQAGSLAATVVSD